MSLLERIREDLIHTVMTPRSTSEVDRRDRSYHVTALRALIAALEYEQKKTGATSLSSSEELTVLTREIKKYAEAGEAAQQAGRYDQQTEYDFELASLKAYAPSTLTEDEVRERIRHIVVEQNCTSPQDFGKVMRVLSPEIKGRFDGKRAVELVKENMVTLGTVKAYGNT